MHWAKMVVHKPERQISYPHKRPTLPISLILDFGSRSLWESKHLLFEPPSPVFARESLVNSFKKFITSFVSNYLRSHNAQKWALGKLILKNEIPGPFWTYPWFDFIMCGSSIFVKLLLWLAIPLVLSIPITARIKSSYTELLQQWQCLYGQTAESVPGADGKPGERK